MTSAHILYIPIIFLLGFLTGTLITRKADQSNSSTISGKLVVGAFVIFMIAFIGTHFFPIPRSSKAVSIALNGREIFDKKPSYSAEEVFARISHFPEAGIELYKSFTYTIDVLFPLTLLAFLFLLSRFIVDQSPAPKPLKIVASLLPIVWFAIDMVENSVIYQILNRWPEPHNFLAGSLGYITITKFTLLLLSILTPVLIILLRKKFATAT
jgi:hypothetical protein